MDSSAKLWGLRPAVGARLAAALPVTLVAVLAASLLQPPAAFAADHADAPLFGNTPIPGTDDTLVDIGLSWTEGPWTLFDGADDKGNTGFGMLKWRDPTSLKFHKIAPDPAGEAALSGSSFAYLVDEAGAPAIYGVADVEDWSPVLLVRAGDELGGFEITDLGPFDLGGHKLVVIAKKANGEAIFGLPDFSGGDPVLLAQTGSVTPDLGDITAFRRLSTDGLKVAFQAVTPDGEGVYLTEDWSGNKYNPVVSTNRQIPGSGANPRFQLFDQLKWNGKKVTFQGGDGDTLEGIYFQDDVGDPEAPLQVVADTASSWLPDPDLLLQDIEGFSVAGNATAFVALASDNSRAGYLDDLGKAKRLLADGDLLEAGQKVMTFDATHQALGSYVVTGTLEGGERALVIAQTAVQLPALPGLGLQLLLATGMVAVALALYRLRHDPQA